jgi:phage terminase large subunit GpA-like protein
VIKPTSVHPYALERAALLAEFDAIRARCLAPLSTVTPREFAETVMKMPDAFGATRPFTFDFAPYQLEPYLEIFNPRNVEVAMMMASRLGKSRIVLTALGFIIKEQPCRIGAMWPVEGDGKLWVKDDFMGELVEPTPELAAIIDNSLGQRKSTNTILHKRFTGGSLTTLGANAPGRMRRMKARVLYADEIDAIIEITTDEGDQLKIFAKRGSEYPDCIQIYCSYPSLKGKSRIEAKLLASDLRQWFVTCLLCGGAPMIMSRTGLDPFNDGKPRTRLRYDLERPEEARLECPHCSGLLNDAQRHAMMMGGDPKKPRFDLWKPTRPFAGRAGFHANSLLWPHPVDPVKYPGGFLEILARKEIEIEESENPERARRVLVNTDDAETYASASDAKPEHSKLFLRREEFDPAQMLPAGVLLTVFFVDVQLDRLELFIQGFGQNQQQWDLDYQVIRGGKGAPLVKPDQGVWAELDRILLTTTYPHPSGRTMRISGGLVDAGNWRDHVFEFTRTRLRRRIWASRGDTELSRAIVENRPRKEGKHKTKVWVLGTNAAKEIIYQRLDQDNPASTGYRHTPALGQFSEHYFKMLVAETSEDRQGRDGDWHKWFGCEQGVRNEALDGAVGCLAAEKILKPRYDKLALEFEVGKPSPQPGKASPNDVQTSSNQKPETSNVKPASPRSFVQKGSSIRPGRGFVSGWKR